MDAWIPVWLFLRAMRWAGFIAFVVMSILFLNDRAAYVTMFGQLKHWVEGVFYFSGLVFVMVGLLELAAREKAGLPRPALGEIIPQRTTSQGG